MLEKPKFYHDMSGGAGYLSAGDRGAGRRRVAIATRLTLSYKARTGLCIGAAPEDVETGRVLMRILVVDRDRKRIGVIDGLE
jgi:hypothetical protein